MSTLLDLLREFGLGFVFANVLLEQGGVPVPAVPTMMVAGAVTAMNRGSVPLLIAVAVAAAVLADALWYYAGRRLGMRVLRVLCRISLSPDACVRQTESIFARFGPSSMLVAKFIPGFASVSTALAGAVRVRFWKFLVFDTIGATLWVGVAVAVGYVFREALNDVLDTLAALGQWGLMLILAALAAYVMTRWWQHRVFVRRLRMDRVNVEQLLRLIETGAIGAILDVRAPIHQQETGRIPGARAVDIETLEGIGDLVEDGEVVVYCACPNEESAVRVAKRLRERGFRRVRPLQGGMDAWIAAGLEVSRDPAPRAAA